MDKKEPPKFLHEVVGYTIKGVPIVCITFNPAHPDNEWTLKK